jgi:hypothetical protein
MLARLYPPKEAISIWVEFVEERKKRLRESQERLHLQSLAAMEVVISQDQLAEWDASARAWLRAADRVMEMKQTQLMLIIGNVNLPVNTKPEVYDSVLLAWTSALGAVENMLCGKAQTVQDGAISISGNVFRIPG